MAAQDLPIRIAPDRMSADVDFAARAGALPSPEEVRAALSAAGVVHGVDDRRIAAALARAAAGVTRVRIAEGTPAVEARAEALERYDAASAEAACEEERIDFREQGRFVSVRRGEKLALWTPPRDGRAGRRVDGVELPAGAAVPARFEPGEHVALDPVEDDRFVVVALSDGALVVEEDGWRISVVDVLRIEGDVDLSTGNIDSTGSVVISGSVRSSFRVHAAHDVEVHGTIEDAEVVAGGRVTARGGIVGGDIGRVRAAAGVYTRHAQNARIECDADVVIGDSDLASEITCGGTLRAVEGRGRLSGGKYEAAYGVVAHELGSPLGAATVVIVARDRLCAERRRDVLAELTRLDAAVETNLREQAAGALDRDRARKLREAIRRRVELRREAERLAQRAEALENHLRQRGPPSVEVRRQVHAGVAIEIRGAKLAVHERSGARTFAIDPATGEVA